MQKIQTINTELEELAKKKTQVDAQIAALDARRHLLRKKTKTALNGFWVI